MAGTTRAGAGVDVGVGTGVSWVMSVGMRYGVRLRCMAVKGRIMSNSQEKDGHIWCQPPGLPCH